MRISLSNFLDSIESLAYSRVNRFILPENGSPSSSVLSVPTYLPGVRTKLFFPISGILTALQYPSSSLYFGYPFSPIKDRYVPAILSTCSAENSLCDRSTGVKIFLASMNSVSPFRFLDFPSFLFFVINQRHAGDCCSVKQVSWKRDHAVDQIILYDFLPNLSLSISCRH